MMRNFKNIIKKVFGLFCFFISFIFISTAIYDTKTVPVFIPFIILFVIFGFSLLEIKADDIFGKKLKIQISKLQNENQALKEELQREILKLDHEKQDFYNRLEDDRNFITSEKIRITTISQSIEADNVIALNQIIENLKQQKSILISGIDDKTKNFEILQNKINMLTAQKTSLEQTINLYSLQLNSLEYGIYEPRYKFVTSSSYKAKLDEIRAKQSELIKSDLAVTGQRDWEINGDKKKGKQMVNKTIKLMLRAFNGECDSSIYKIKYNNFSTIEKRIRKSFEDINKMNSEMQFSISYNYLDLKIQELYLAYEYELKLQEEKEILREQREKEREEKALQKEIAAKKQKISKEILHMNNAIESLQEKLGSATEEEKIEIEKTIEQLKNNIEDFDQQQKDLDYRIENIGAGYVYIISNIGAFGENIFKIGVTRRLDPLERIAELSSASVPFKFDVHALIFSYKAYELESELHKRFEKNRINLVNNRKEFFNIDINEIEQELNNYKDLTIEFKRDADADEYRESLNIRKTVQYAR